MFFFNSKEAKAAGFRACLRCRPEEDGKDSRQVQIVKRTCSYVEENYEDKLTLSKIAEREGISPYYLHRIFKKITGVTPREYDRVLQATTPQAH